MSNVKATKPRRTGLWDAHRDDGEFMLKDKRYYAAFTSHEGVGKKNKKTSDYVKSPCKKKKMFGTSKLRH